MIYYNEKRDYLTKGKMLTEGEEEHWYSARVNFMMKRYEDFVGTFYADGVGETNRQHGQS